MVFKKAFYIFFGFIMGIVAANVFFSQEVMAQYGGGKSGAFSEDDMTPEIPSSYGRLVAVSGIEMYFQGEDGSITIVKPRTRRELDTNVVVIKRGK
ncbi:MAG TPA: hypothetical protein DCL35_05210 [Candidatus Omnitrophica bacterium]|nr:hypothetical protein [Candidatus Omnitrophota bacterium]